MTFDPRLVRTLPTILDDLSAAPTPDYLDDVFAQTGRMRQRPAWTFPERWLPVADITRSRVFAPVPPWRMLALALVVIALIAGALIYAGSRQQPVPAPFGPARNGLITYETGGDIYVGDPVSGDSKLLLGGTTDDHDPGFSPDGTWIAFLRSGGSGDDIYLIRPDGSDLRRVTTTPLVEMTWTLWTADSRHFGVIRTVADTGRFETIDLDGTVRAPAPGYNVQGFVDRPPLGQEILLRVDQGDDAALVALDATGTIHPIRTSKDDGGNPLALAATYSPDGSHIYFQTSFRIEPDFLCCQLWVMEADGSNAHPFPDERLTNAWEGQPVVSPDGRWVAFWRVQGDTQHASVVRADGTGPVIPVGPTLKGLVNFAWAPDSSKVLISTRDDADEARQYVAGLDGQWTTARWETRTSPDWQRLAR